MAFNPLELMKMKERLDLFSQQHPRFGMFLRDVGERAVMPGTVLEIRVTTPEGKEYITNIRLTQDDVQTIEMARQAKHPGK